ncbi:MAG: COX15/CtaA family protein [Candidatus Omnitrophica bacterium]|nr:COX15/CtaA family protein [Candidatus Omnitrophota bacterium]
MNQLWLGRYTKLLVGVTFLLIIAGGLVTSTQSGLSVPDWPLSYGKLMPPMVGGVRYEHTHRMIASLVGIMTLVLALWLGFKESRTWVRCAGIAAFGAVVVQGILGGLTVMYLLPAPISIFHACLAQTFFALIVSLAFFTSREWFSAEGKAGSNFSELKQPLVMMVTLVYLQLILGATLRHTVNQFVSISHMVNGFFVLISSVVVMLRILNRYEHEKRLVYPVLFLGALTLFQIALGMGAFIYVFMLQETIQPEAGKIFFVTAHQALGALLLAVSVFLTLRVYRLSPSLAPLLRSDSFGERLEGAGGQPLRTLGPEGKVGTR